VTNNQSSKGKLAAEKEKTFEYRPAMEPWDTSREPFARVLVPVSKV